MPMMMGVTPARSDPNTISRTTIATMMPIVSPFLKSSSEILLKSSVEVGSPSMYIWVPSVLYRARIAFRSSTMDAVSSVLPVRIAVNSTAVPSCESIGPSAATSGLAASWSESGYAVGTVRTTLGSRPRMSFSAALTFSANAGSEVAPASPVITKDSGDTSCSRPSRSRVFCAAIASGLFVKSKSLVSAGLRRVLIATNPAIRITAQIPMVLPGCLLLARASVSGFSFIRSPFRQTLPKPALTYDVCLRCMGA